MAKGRGVNKSANSMNSPEQRILIVFSSGIGNMVLFLPTLKAIRDKYPNAKIILWAKEMVVYELVKNTGLINEVWPYYHKKFANLFRQLFVYLKLCKKKYDIIISTFIERDYKVRLFIMGLRGKMKLGYRANSLTDCCYTHLFDYDVNEHESDRHFKIAEFLDKKAAKNAPDLHLGEKEEKFAQQFLTEKHIPQGGLIIGMHPGCSEFARNKRWLPENFAKVANVISKKYKAKIILFGGKEEISLGEKVVSYMRSCVPVSLVGKATILETAAVIKKCDLFISNDSGLMHVAAAVNTPTIAVFGPTNPAKNAPFGDGHIIVRKKLLCSPCLNYNSDECRDLKCLKMLTVEDVLDAVDKKLNSFMIAK